MDEMRLCRMCRMPMPEDDKHYTCPDCREREARKMTERYRKRRALGLCVACGDPAMPGRCRCLTCARMASMQASESGRRRRAREKEAAGREERGS